MNKRLASVALILLLSPVALAQQNQKLRDRDPDLAAAKKLASDLQQANIHSGPFYFFSRLRISDAGYTEGGYVPTGDSSGGINLAIEAPQRLYFVPRKKNIYSIEFDPSYTFFRESKRGNQFNYLVRGDAHFLLNHLYLDLYGSTADQLRAHVADINRLATTKENEVGVGGEVKYSSRTSGLFIVRRRNTTYPKDRFQPDPLPESHLPLEVLDRHENNARLSILHKTFPRTSLFLAGEFSDYKFPNKEAYRSKRTYAGGGFAFEGSRNSLRVEAGPMKLDFDDPSQPDFEGMTADVRLARANPKWGISFGAQRDLGFSIFLNNAFYKATSVQGGLDYNATRKLTLHLRSAFERDEYETPVLGQERTDDISFSSIGFTYGIRRIRFGGDVGWYERDSTAFGDVDSGIRYIVRLSLTP